MAGFQIFVAGHPVARRLYEEEFAWASKRECLFGPYVSGTDREGHPVGHRHDQSILSILALRQRIACVVGNPLICMTSLRKTYQRGAAIYLHRGNYVGHRQVLPGIDDVWVVNLDRRPDRWTSWLAAHPSLQAIANRLPAVDGKSLQLTPALERLFAGNDFHWKKSVTGCALSHILLWAQLVCEHPSVKNYLIFEDDHRFKDPGWQATFAKAMATVPADAELLYFGGVLPGNRPSYEMCTEPVNDIWATIKPNPCFTGGRGLAPIFHFCAYSYLLTRKGAEKLLAILRTEGCKTSIDHFLGWPAFGLKKYVMQDLMASCFQDDDPAYVNSAFDDMKRVDVFDSDIWNNKECFTPSTEQNEKGVALWQALEDVLAQAPHSIQTARTLRPEPVSGVEPMHVFYFDTKTDTHDGQVEGLWLKDLHPGYTLHPFSLDSVMRVPMPWLLVARPNIPFWSSVCAELDRRSKPYCVLHLSDELGTDALELYKGPFCKKVVRNYLRPDLPDESKVEVIPLGYAVRPPLSVASALPSYTKREYVWAFHGTRWFEREAQLAPLQSIGPNSCKWQDGFLSPTMTPPAEYSRLLLQSRFVPVPRGNNVETFRLYEALEHGCIPLYVRTAGDETYWQWLQKHVTLVELKDWEAAARLVRHLESAPDAAEQYRQGLMTQWQTWKEACKKALL
jgi:GR25 family glycosyltransferase involved in LPS biosynthesis